MLNLALAQQLRAAGLPWEPKPGDRFVLPLPEMEEEVFILSNVIADVHRFMRARRSVASSVVWVRSPVKTMKSG